MLAVVGDQVPQVLSFQFSIGDARSKTRTLQRIGRLVVSILYWRCKIADVDLHIGELHITFQFSIGDAFTIYLYEQGFNTVCVSFQFSIGDAHCPSAHRTGW